MFSVTTEDYQRLAQKRLPGFLYDYIDGGCNDEVTMAANLADFRRYCLKQRVMCDVSNVDTATQFFGQQVGMPLALAPVGMAGLMARRGEVQGALAAKAAGIPFTASTVGICSLKEIQEATQSPFWFQLYMLRDRDVVSKLIDRAHQAGCNTLVLTVDLAVSGMRHRDQRHGIGVTGLRSSLVRIPQILARPRWIADVGIAGGPHTFGNIMEFINNAKNLNDVKSFVDSQFDPTVTWQDIAWVRSLWSGKLLIKGVLEADDARCAADVGADGVVVSNHGGRQLDGVASSISKLPGVVSAVGDDIQVFMDGGIRSGIDVVKAVALGAQGVMIGRPWVWALAAKKEAGLRDLLSVFKKEIEVAMALMGVNSIQELHTGLIERPDS